MANREDGDREYQLHLSARMSVGAVFAVFGAFIFGILGGAGGLWSGSATEGFGRPASEGQRWEQVGIGLFMALVGLLLVRWSRRKLEAAGISREEAVGRIAAVWGGIAILLIACGVLGFLLNLIVPFPKARDLAVACALSALAGVALLVWSRARWRRPPGWRWPRA